MIHADYSILNDCAAGDPSAWQQLYNQCQPALLRSIGAILGSGYRDRHLIEEISARVWYSLATNPARIFSQFEPQRASLNTYLAVIARAELSAYLRSEKRRRRRELISTELLAHSNPDLAALDQTIDEFIQTLTPKEKQFCNCYLLGRTEAQGGEPSSTSRWQLRHRVHQKLLKFLRTNDSAAARQGKVGKPRRTAKKAKKAR